MILAADAKRLSDAANLEYTIDQVSKFITDRAGMGFTKVVLASRRWSVAVDDAIRAAGFTSVENEHGQVEVSW